MMDKTFDPAAVEARIGALWDAKGAFKAGAGAREDEKAGGKPYAIVIPPPNVTGSLHMGHALNNTLQDILCRFERMRGKDVLWQPGMDHAGIATQLVVERQLAARGEADRRAMGREAFVNKIWEWKAESGGAIIAQLKRLGASCDWSRERFTMDDGLSRAVTKVFVELYREGLIYKDQRLVNWDPKLQTAISDLEVVPIETKGAMWRLKYPIADAQGAPTGAYIVVATTRPETMLGDSGVAVHPDDERYRHLQGRQVLLPIVGRLIPIVADQYSDPEKGTGAVKITPAHDFNDFEVGRRHRLPLINIFDAQARLTLADNDAFAAGAVDPLGLNKAIASLDGLSREDARVKILEMLDAEGLVESVEPHLLQQPHGERSGVVVEPYLTEQWYVDAKTLAQPALEAVRSGKTRFIPKNWEKTYYDWLENIQPWCVSRQLWWGHQIPAYYSAWGGVYVAASFEEALVQALADAAAREILSDAEAARIAADPDSFPDFLTRDEDVLDTWFSSALWPFSTLGWPDETHELKKYYPTAVLVTGFDIIFFWVARMMMMGRHFMQEVPFRDVYIHGLVRDAKGAKMSKTKGNGVDPLVLIDQYGADALRFTLAALATQGRDVKLSIPRVEGYRAFATKLWNAARFAEMNECARIIGFDPGSARHAINRWVLGEAARAARETTSALESYKFNEAASAVYRFVWNVFCDWYVELAKPLFMGSDEAAKAEARATTAWTLDVIFKLLHPFMPFITEELWAIKGQDGPVRENLLMLSPWPELTGLGDPASEAEVGWLVDLVSEIRSLRAEINAPAGASAPLTIVGADAPTMTRARHWEDTIKRLARVSDISFAPNAPAGSAQMIVRGTTFALPLADMIDIAAERARLAKEIAKLEADNKKIEAKLGNADFLARAPEDVVAENRARVEESQAKIEKLTGALRRLA